MTLDLKQRAHLLRKVTAAIMVAEPAPHLRPDERIAVLAGNYQQFADFMRRNGLDRRKYFYVGDGRKLLGRHGFAVIRVGQFYLNHAGEVAVREAIGRGDATEIYEI